jgi:exosortase E/protease (VPEID-CTERM system)
MMSSEISAAGLNAPTIPGAPGKRLLSRVIWLAGLLAAEWLPISALVNTGRGGQATARALVAFLFCFLTFGYFRVRNRIPQLSRRLEETPVAWRFLWAHFGAMAVFLALSLGPPDSGFFGRAVLLAGWYGAGLLAIVLAACAFVPMGEWLNLLRATGHVWVIGAVAAIAAWQFVSPLQSVWDGSLWKPAIDATFGFTGMLLRPFLPDLVIDRAALVMGSSHFQVMIGGACSGFEGAGLMLAFSSGWLWFFRRESRFPQALLLIPGSIAVMWVLNAVRIAALILIGNAGFPDIAIHGFHSQAGWISFNLVAISVSLAAARVPWWTKEELSKRKGEAQLRAGTSENPTAWYLMPFVAILAASMVSHAVSGSFEWAYPVRLFAAAGVLWFLRSNYRRLDWRVSWFGPVAGLLVFILWIWLEPVHGAGASNGFAALSAAPPFARSAWLVCRTLAAIFTVPIAEELAFRGFLIRRLLAADFESLDLRRFSYFGVLVSSLAFGLLHGDRWVAGTLAGVVYAFALLRRGRIGDAVVAHATTNAMIAAAVLVAGKWYLW